LTTFETTIIFQRKRGIDTKTKLIERKRKNNISIKEKIITKIVKQMAAFLDLNGMKAFEKTCKLKVVTQEHL